MIRNPSYISESMILRIQRDTQDQMSRWTTISGLPTYMSRWFAAARDEAFKSNFHTAKVGCVIIYRNHIVGRGHNQLKTDTTQAQYNQMYREWTNDAEFSNTCGHTAHAEIDALNSITYPIAQKLDWKRTKVYVYRVAQGLEGYTGLSLPCPACAAALSDVGIRKVYYTTGHLDHPFGQCDL